jgi:hypothetical protein
MHTFRGPNTVLEPEGSTVPKPKPAIGHCPETVPLASFP